MLTAFYIIATLTMISGVAAVSMRNMVHCVLALIGFFAGVAAIFFTLHAEFLGAVQIIVYVGAVAVLLLFAVMLTRRVTGEEPVSPSTQIGPSPSQSGSGHAGGTDPERGSSPVERVSPFSGGSGWGILASAAILCAILYSLPDANALPPPPNAPSFSVMDLGQALMTRYAVPFEVISLLLTAALIGAVVVAVEEPGKKGGASQS